MGRGTRVDNEDGWHHVMNRGVDHQSIFGHDRDRVEFERLIGRQRVRNGIELHAYCLMGNHFHLLVHCPDGGLSRAMHDLGSLYVRYFNDRLGRDGPLFRSRFTSIAIDTDAYLLAAVRYIHRNPIDLSPPTPIDRYRWSSHGVYVGHRSAPDWLSTDHVLAHFSADRTRFARFVDDRDPTEQTALTQSTHVVTGDDIRRAVHDVALNPAAVNGARRASIERVLGVLLIGDQPAPARSGLARALGFASDGAARTALSRARARVKTDPIFDDLLHQARRALADRSVTRGAWHHM